MEILFSSDRAFTLEHYNAEKGLLLIRSPMYFMDPSIKNVDLMFSYTNYIGIPITLHGIKLRAGTEEEYNVFLEPLKNIALHTSNMFSEKDFFAIESQGGVFYILASQYAIDENVIPIEETIVADPPTIDGWNSKHKEHYEALIWKKRTEQ
ncbi:hypothetical protein [Aureispira anguillae]|uniref:Uncharacterized protein n=1 Tax=Aureispira anguillae TaxID=2864201 RepID=A0A915YCD1_9BACT|nr:hypothetical protein [Aureispira anguillae]BDS10493.1 hypothetical protein AsAng_0012010 [Aureispira anguillae]